MTSNNDGQDSATASSSISRTAQQATQQAGDMLNILGDKAEALKGQNETVDKAVTYVQDNVLGTKIASPGPEGTGDGESNEKILEATDEQVEDFLRDRNRSVK